MPSSRTKLSLLQLIHRLMPATSTPTQSGKLLKWWFHSKAICILAESRFALRMIMEKEQEFNMGKYCGESGLGFIVMGFRIRDDEWLKQASKIWNVSRAASRYRSWCWSFVRSQFKMHSRNVSPIMFDNFDRKYLWESGEGGGVSI